MKQIFPFYLILIIFSCDRNDPEPGIEIALNGDMETGATFPMGWNFAPGLIAGHSSSWSTEQASSGTRSLSISTPGNINSIALWSQYYGNADKNVSGKDLTFLVKVKGNNLAGLGISIAMRADAGSGNKFVTTEGVKAIKGTFDWTTYAVNIPLVPEDATGVYLFLIFLPNSTGTVYFDDASLTYK
jgi:hypothetical protein